MNLGFLPCLPWIFLQSALGKWNYKSKRQAIVHEGYMFPLLVNKQLEDWPEKSIRKRRWVSLHIICLSIYHSCLIANYLLGNLQFVVVLKGLIDLYDADVCG